MDVAFSNISFPSYHSVVINRVFQWSVHFGIFFGPDTEFTDILYTQIINYDEYFSLCFDITEAYLAELCIPVLALYN